jgi:hypothetical protein
MIAESTGPLMSLGEPPCVGALLLDPGRARTPGHTASRCCRRMHARRRPRREITISGLHHTAPTLAVYASQGGSPRHHARLASGWWPAFAGPDWKPARVHAGRFLCLMSAFDALSTFPPPQGFMTHASAVTDQAQLCGRSVLGAGATLRRKDQDTKTGRRRHLNDARALARRALPAGTPCAAA